MYVQSCHLLLDHVQFALIHGYNIQGSCAILFFIASEFTFTNRYIHNRALFLFPLCPSYCILSGAIYVLFPCSLLDTYRPGVSSSSIISFWLFIVFMEFSREEYWSGLPFYSPMDCIFSELSMIRPSWVALHGMVHSFIEWYKTVTHVIILLSFRWLWFSFWRLWDYSTCFFCLHSDEWG